MAAPSDVAALVRWHNALIAGAGVAVGAWWAGAQGADGRVTGAVVAALALAAFANTVNDIHDVDIDRVAHPGRPLPRQAISERGAWRIAMVAAIVALAAASLARPGLGVLTAAVLATMFLYSRTLKRYGIPGNVVVAVVASLPFLYGAWAAGRPAAALPLVGLAVPLHFAREIAKDLDDVPGDAGLRSTLPLAHGPRVARVALIVALLAFGAMLVPWVMRWPRFALLISPALVLCMLGAWRAVHGRQGGPLRFKAAMVLAMASLVALRAF